MKIKDLSDFEKAEQVMAAAMYVSELKPKHLGHAHVDGMRHEEFLHDLAQHLAGERVEELYPSGE